MKHIEPDQPGLSDLLRENEDLRRQIRDLENGGHGAAQAGPPQVWHPSSTTVLAIFLIAVVMVVIAFFAGYLPLKKRQEVIAGEARDQEHTLRKVDVIQVGRASDQSVIALPGSIQAITEAP